MLCRKAPTMRNSLESYEKNRLFTPWSTACGLVSFFRDAPMLKRLTFLAAFTSLLALPVVQATAQTAPNQASPLGTNLADVNYYSSEQPFLNIVKTGGGWSTLQNGTETGEEVLLYTSFLDANGYPTTLTGGASHNFNQVSVLLLAGLKSSDVTSPTYQAGDYLLQWSGSGTFTYRFDPGNGTCSTSPCKITVGSPSPGGILLTLTSTGSGSNYAKNISLIYCGKWNGTSCTNGYDTLLANGEIFNPTFITLISPFKTLRFMKWMATQSNFQKNWTDRPLPGWVFWADNRTNATINGADPRTSNDGVPAEVMFALCNQLRTDCWFNMPPLSTDDYVTQFATLAHSSLNTSSKVYVEYANELWNQTLCQPSGTMTESCIEQVGYLCAALEPTVCPYPTSYTAYQANTLYGAIRAVQNGATWKTVWGAELGRVIRVFGSGPYPYYNSSWLGWKDPGGNFSGTVGQNVDVLAFAPYFGYAVPDTFTLDQLFTEMMSGGLVSTANGGYPGGMIKQMLDESADDYSVASSFGLALVTYEGGQGLVDYSGSDTALEALYAAANRDPRMGTAYTTLLNGWKSLGGNLFINFTDIQQYSKFGYWGALENYQDTNSPKYGALTGFISANSCWWTGCATSTPATTPASTTPPSVPAGLAGALASATQINLTWAASTDNAGTVAGYNVFRNGAKIGTSTSTSYQDTNLSSGTTYTYTVSAHDTAGNTSAQSSAVSVSTPAPPKVTISSPSNGTAIRANGNINIAVSASDPSGIQTITITGDSKILHTCTGTTSCSTTWPGHEVSRGTHVVGATAIGALGLKSNASVTIVDLR